jgi:hypothetical protein
MCETKEIIKKLQQKVKDLEERLLVIEEHTHPCEYCGSSYNDSIYNVGSHWLCEKCYNSSDIDLWKWSAT